jgi:hypothetical protein
MFLARLSGYYVKLKEVTAEEVSEVLFNEKSLTDGRDITGMIGDKNVIYWSAYNKNNGEILGLIGVSLGLEPNQIFFKFINIEQFEYKYIEDALKLVLDYLEYKKLNGHYAIQFKQTGYTYRQTLTRLGFIEKSKNIWIVNV